MPWPRRACTVLAAVAVLASACGGPGPATVRRVGHAAAAGAASTAPRPARRSDRVRTLLGRSYRGRGIEAVRAGDPRGPRILVVGCIHGDETAGIAVARALERTRSHVRVRPRVTVWFHQHMDLVWAFGAGTSARCWPWPAKAEPAGVVPGSAPVVVDVADSATVVDTGGGRTAFGCRSAPTA